LVIDTENRVIAANNQSAQALIILANSQYRPLLVGIQRYVKANLRCIKHAE
jgi:hypothetical protein